MRNFRLWGALALALVLIGAGVWAYWNFELRWRPTPLTKHQAEIAATLNAAGWVSPGGAGRPVYMVAYRDCAACDRVRDELLPDLRAKGFDTRVILVARRDVNGVAQSTPTERATVAQLWITRDRKLLQAWEATAPGAWTARGIPSADGDMARMAVVEAGRGTVEKLTPLLKDNGLRFGYPLLVWWTAGNEMRSCVCDRPQTYRFVRKDLTAG